MKKYLSLLTIALLCSCAHQSPSARSLQNAGMGGILMPKKTLTGHGDVGGFILQKAVRYGKKVPPATKLPLISNQWTYTEYYHSQDISINLPQEKFADVKSFLDQFFGPADSQRDGKNAFYTYGLAKPVDSGAIHIYVSNSNAENSTIVSIIPP